MDIKVNLNTSELASLIGEKLEQAKQLTEKAVASLATQTHAKILEMAQQELRSTRQIYVDNLTLKQENSNVWLVVLDDPAMFIEDGRPAGSMVDDLLRNNAKISKSGKKYKVIPLKKNTPPTSTPISQMSLRETLASELKKISKIRKQHGQEGISMTKIERHVDGTPKIGNLHRFDIRSGKVGVSGKDYLHGITVSQKMNKDGGVDRFIGTFRVVTEDHKAQGRWFHPGLAPKDFFERATRWAEQEWDSKIYPEIIKIFSE